MWQYISTCLFTIAAAATVMATMAQKSLKNISRMKKKMCERQCNMCAYSNRVINHKTNSCLPSFAQCAFVHLISRMIHNASDASLRCDQAERTATALINKLLWLLYVCRLRCFPLQIITFIRIWIIVSNLSVSFFWSLSHFHGIFFCQLSLHPCRCM